MKHPLLILLFMLLAVTAVKAQKFKGGTQAGLVVSQIAGDRMSGYNKAGVHGGFFVSYPIKEPFSLQMELAYIQKGSAQSANIETGAMQYIRRMNYVELPLLLQYSLQPLIIEAGISTDFLVGSFEEANFMSIDQIDQWRKTTFNTVIGVRYALGTHWQLILRSVNSINSIRKESVPYNVRRYTKKYGEFNDLLLFGVGWQF